MDMPVHYAGFWIRALAHLIDTLLLTVASSALQLMIYGAVYWIQYLVGEKGAEVPAFSEAFNPFIAQVVNSVLYLLLAAPYYVWLQWKDGSTLGKKVCKIRVVQVGNFQPITLRQSVMRFFSYLASYLPLLAGFLMAAIQPQKRCLHDLLAGTVSIKGRREDAIAPPL